MQFIGTGKHSSVFRSNDNAIKLLNKNMNNQYNFNKINHEFNAIIALAEHGMPTPRNAKLIINELKKKHGIQYDFINGILAKNFKFTEENNKKFQSALKIFFEKLHSIQLPLNKVQLKKTNISKDIYPKIIEENKKLFTKKEFDQIITKIELHAKKKNFINSPNVMLHGDISNSNIILLKNGSINGVIDWSECMIGDPAYDLAGVLIYFGEKTLKSLLIHENYSTEMLERINYYASMEYLFRL
ncbi:MAG: aminoglycoside phosphotransferase family protein [Dehalococcoidia bacterium]